MVTDTIADFLIRIKNGYMAHKETVSIPCANILMEIGAILKREGYIADMVKENNTIVITLLYTSGRPAFEQVVRVSSPGQRIYEGVKKLPHVMTGYGMAIVSTPKGLLTDTEARKQKVGGEVICKIW
jgi:small subunit ribosomal protein S8